MRPRARLLVVGILLVTVAVGSLGGSVAAQESPTATPTPTETSGVASDRGLASFAIVVVLVGATIVYLYRRRVDR